MQVQKVKVLKTGTTIELEASNEGTPEGRTLKDCPDRSPELEKALGDLVSEACRLLGFTRKQEQERVRLTGVSVSKDSNGHRAFVITGKYRTNVGETSLNVPRMMEPVEGAEGERVLTDVSMKRIDALLKAALAYYNGDREQTEMDLGEKAAEG